MCPERTQEAVIAHAWLTPGEMIDGLALAETTPGPLIMVVQFVGFIAAHRDPGMLPPEVAGLIGAMLTTWVTFVPCFLWIFLGAPHMEELRKNSTLTGAMNSVTAAVVGAIANLALWFSIHVLFSRVASVPIAGAAFDLPVLYSVQIVSLMPTAAAALLVFGLKTSIPMTLAITSVLGIATLLL